jgi:hypothetical protein
LKVCATELSFFQKKFTQEKICKVFFKKGRRDKRMGGRMRQRSPAWRILFLPVLALLALTAWAGGPVWADGEAKPAAPSPKNMDLALFTEEIQAAGAIKFYESTEEILRLAQFERALLRYRFLKGQIAGQSFYRGLTAQVDQRLRFLGEQMRLHSADLGPVGSGKQRQRHRTVASVQKKGAPPKETGKKEEALKSSGKKEEEKPAAPKAEAAAPPPKGEAEAGPAAPPPPETGLPPQLAPEEKGKEEKTSAQPPPPQPSRWDRVKQKLQFWKKSES